MNVIQHSRHKFVLAAIAVATFCSTSSLLAAPVTLRFDATINTVFPGVPFDSGIDFGVGDVISGRFTFDPAETSPGDLLGFIRQPYPSEILIDGQLFRTPATTTLVGDNAFISEFPPDDVGDLIWVAGSLGPKNPALFPNISPMGSSFQIRLLGNRAILSTATLPTDAAIWNGFLPERQISVFFRGGTAGAIGFQATIQNFVAVPEPAVVSSVCLACALLLVGRRRPYIFLSR